LLYFSKQISHRACLYWQVIWWYFIWLKRLQKFTCQRRAALWVFSLNICYIFPSHALGRFIEVLSTYECLAYIYFFPSFIVWRFPASNKVMILVWMSFFIYYIFRWAIVSMKKEVSVNFLTNSQEGRSTLRPTDVVVYWWIGG